MIKMALKLMTVHCSKVDSLLPVWKCVTPAADLIEPGAWMSKHILNEQLSVMHSLWRWTVASQRQYPDYWSHWFGLSSQWWQLLGISLAHLEFFWGVDSDFVPAFWYGMSETFSFHCVWDDTLRNGLIKLVSIDSWLLVWCPDSNTSCGAFMCQFLRLTSQTWILKWRLPAVFVYTVCWHKICWVGSLWDAFSLRNAYASSHVIDHGPSHD